MEGRKGGGGGGTDGRTEGMVERTGRHAGWALTAPGPVALFSELLRDRRRSACRN
jgi:hypothetical protein